MVSSDDQRIPCFKAVLAIRSEAFMNMLTSTYVEVQKGEIRMEDFDGNTLACFWNYLIHTDLKYALKCQHEQAKEDQGNEDIGRSDTIFRITELALNMLVLGDKYGIDCLKEDCLVWLKLGMRTTTVLSVIKVAHRIEAQELLQHALDFVFENRFDQNLQPSLLVDDDMPTEIRSQIMERFLKAGPKKS